MAEQEKWGAIIRPLITSPFELVSVEWVGKGKHQVLRVYIDKPGGITIDEIVLFTRKINVVLDVENPLPGYTLEVSSPGIKNKAEQ